MKGKDLSLTKLVEQFGVSTASALRQLVIDVDAASPDDQHQCNVALILLASLWAGEDAQQIASFAGLDTDYVHAICERLYENGVFGCGHNRREEYLSDDGYLTLSMEVACGMGWVKRCVGSNGEPAFQMTNDGKQYVEKTLIPDAKKKREARS